jgi:hypothetical protein
MVKLITVFAFLLVMIIGIGMFIVGMIFFKHYVYFFFFCISKIFFISPRLISCGYEDYY